MGKNTMSGDEREAKLLDIGAKLAAKHGHKNVTRRMVAQAGKVSEGLVAHYIGSAKEAQKLYKARAKKLGLVEPDAEKAAAIGIKLRKVGPRATKTTRKRSVREVQAIKRKTCVPAKAIVRTKGNVTTVKRARGFKGDLRDVAIPGVTVPPTRTERDMKASDAIAGLGKIAADTSKVIAKRERDAANKRAKRAERKAEGGPPQDKALPGAPENKSHAARPPKAPPVGVIQ